MVEMYKALMIEDHKEVRDFVKEYFDHKEIEVIEAQNGYEGLAILDDTIDIILLDIMMPGIDGYEVCKQIRSQYNTLIVFISALSEDENQLKAYEYGADDYITKPFKPSLLYAKCLALLKRNKKIETNQLQSGKVILDLDKHILVIEENDIGVLRTTGAQRTGCEMCGFGIHLEQRPHRFDRLRERNPKAWEFWMYRCCTDPETGEKYGWGRVLDYIGVEWEDIPPVQMTIFDYPEVLP